VNNIVARQVLLAMYKVHGQFLVEDNILQGMVNVYVKVFLQEEINVPTKQYSYQPVGCGSPNLTDLILFLKMQCTSVTIYLKCIRICRECMFVCMCNKLLKKSDTKLHNIT